MKTRLRIALIQLRYEIQAQAQRDPMYPDLDVPFLEIHERPTDTGQANWRVEPIVDPSIAPGQLGALRRAIASVEAQFDVAWDQRRDQAR